MSHIYFNLILEESEIVKKVTIDDPEKLEINCLKSELVEIKSLMIMRNYVIRKLKIKKCGKRNMIKNELVTSNWKLNMGNYLKKKKQFKKQTKSCGRI